MKMNNVFLLLAITSFTSANARALLEKRVVSQLDADRTGVFSATPNIPPAANAWVLVPNASNASAVAAIATQPAQASTTPVKLVTSGGWTFFKVPIGPATDTDVKAACQAAGLDVPCAGPSGCKNNDASCQVTSEIGCGNPMTSTSSALGCSSPQGCAALDGVFAYMGGNFQGGHACGVTSSGFCTPGTSTTRPSSYAFCASQATNTQAGNTSAALTQAAASPATQAAQATQAAPATQAVSALGSQSVSRTLKCVKWRKTLECTPSGARDPMNDKDCLTLIDAQESGFCECEGYVHTAAVPCGHPPVNCTKECGTLQIMHRETFGAGRSDSDDEDVNAPGGADPDRTIEAIKAGKDPYARALKYGQSALRDVNRAVTQSNTLLGSARQMISKMTNLKPWADIQQMGRDAEAAGKKTQELAKIARPFIYTQTP